LYGLVQSPREFYLHFTKVITKMGFTQSGLDPCLWLKVEHGRLVAAIAIYVDDCAIAAISREIPGIKAALQRSFSMTDGGPISWFLGVQLRRDTSAGTLTLDQSAAINRLLSRYSMGDCAPVSIPMDTRLARVSEAIPQEERVFMQNKNYRALVGSLLYLLFTRPDIAYSVNQLTRHLHDPRRCHWVAAIRVLKYLRGTIDLVLCFRREEESSLASIVGWTDADWGMDTETRRSTTGFVFMICGAAISWKTKLQSVVALSTCEAELISLSEASREAIWLKRLGIELMLPSASTPIVINEDNQAALQIVRDHRFSERTKHVALHHFFVRGEVANENLAVQYCSTDKMIADIMTKPLLRVAFQRLRTLLGLIFLSPTKGSNTSQPENS
jgi:hypothetical protein